MKQFSLEELSQVAFQIISFAGEAKSEAMLGIYAARDAADFAKAQNHIKQANDLINQATKTHFELIQEEAQGNQIWIPLILMHAEDQLLSTQSVILLAEEIIRLHQKIKEQKPC